MSTKRLPLDQKAFWIAAIISQIILGLTAIIIPIPYNLFLITLIPLLALLYSKPILGLLFLVPFLPNYPIIFFSIGRADISLLEPFLFIAFVSWLFFIIRNNEIKFYVNRIDIAVFLLFGWCLVSLFWTIDVLRGIFQIIRVLEGLTVYFLHIHLVKDKKDFHLLISAWIVTAICSSLLGFYETMVYGIEAASKLTISETYTHLTRAVRTTAFFQTPDDLGLVLSLCTIFVIIKYMTTPSKPWKLVLMFFMPFIFFVLVSTFSRKSYLAIAAAVTYLSLRNRKALLMFLSISVIGLVLVILLASTGFMEALLNRLESYFKSPEVTITYRWETWQIALKLFFESPIWGKGIGSFFVSAQRLGSPLNVTHDFYVYILAELGLVGLMLVLFWYSQIVLSFVKFYGLNMVGVPNLIATGVVCTLIILFVQSFFRAFMFTDAIFWGILGLASAFLKVYRPDNEKFSITPQVVNPVYMEGSHV
jgi:O-antigen ligase